MKFYIGEPGHAEKTLKSVRLHDVGARADPCTVREKRLLLWTVDLVVGLQDNLSHHILTLHQVCMSMLDGVKKTIIFSDSSSSSIL